MQPNKDSIKTLAQIGFVACFRGMPQQALTIFEGIHAAEPANAKIKTGLGIAYLNAYRMEDAVAALSQSLAMEPDNTTAKNFLGLALKLGGKAEEGDRILREVASQGNEDNKEFANAVLTSDVFNQQSASMQP